VKRSGPIQRKTRMPARGKGKLRPAKPLKKHNPKRQAKTKERAYGGQTRKDWIALHGCLACGRAPSVNAHTRHPSSGGSYKGDACAVVPLCVEHEREKHQHGEDTFNAKYRSPLCGLTLAEWAVEYDRSWRAFSGLTPLSAIVPGVLADLIEDAS
jgi:hypothetical protein